ncbi:MAG: relaxase/mobilization nuclease domain-containing protein [Pseudomonadota bacterium]
MSRAPHLRVRAVWLLAADDDLRAHPRVPGGGVPKEPRTGGARSPGPDRRGAGRRSPRSLMNAVRGAPKAIFKRQKTGGCRTREGLKGQLAYVNDKADAVFFSRRTAFEDGARLDAQEQDALVEAWAATWRGSTKHGFTSHMMISFPRETDPVLVAEIVQDWCYELFESGDHGDAWDHVIAIHSDTDHPHAHILLNNRGRVHGQWFSCWAGGAFTPDLMREKQAEIAERYGIALDASTRLERGLFTKAPPVEEIYAAKAEGRSAKDIPMTAAETAVAHAAMIALAPSYRAFADTLEAHDRRDLARAVTRLAAALEEGPGHRFEPEREIPMRDVVTVAEAIVEAEDRIDRLAAHAETLGGVERARFEAETAGILGALAEFTPDAALRTAYTTELAEVWPPTAEALGGRVTEDSRADARAYAAEIGLDAERLDARLEAGGTQNAGLAQAWIAADIDAMAAKDGLTAADLDPETRAGIAEAIDEYYHRLHGLARSSTLETDPRIALEEIDADPAEAAAWLRDRAGALQIRELSEAEAARFEADLPGMLQTAIGSEGLAALAGGAHEALERAVPDPADRILLTQEFLESTAAAHPERLEIARGLDTALEAAWSAEARHQDPERIAEANAIRATEEIGIAEAERGQGRARDLDDEMGG